MSNPNIGYATLTVIPSLLGIEALVDGQLGGLGAAGNTAGRELGAGINAGAAPGIANVGKLLVGLGAIKFLGTAIGDANKFNEIQGRTANVLLTSAGAAGVNAKQVKQLADQLSLTDAVSGNVAQGAENVVLSYNRVRNVGTGVNAIFDRTVAASIDMSKAMGTDASSAAEQLAKSLQDPEKGMTRLTRQGIILTAQQKDQVRAFQESGNYAAAQGIILGVVEQKFHGAAAAMATDADHARAAAANFARSVGLDLQPAVNVGAHAVTGLLGTFTKLPEGVQQGTLALAIGELAYAKLGDKAAAAGQRLLANVKAHTTAGQAVSIEANATKALTDVDAEWAAASTNLEAAVAGQSAARQALVQATDEAVDADIALGDAEAELESLEASGLGTTGAAAEVRALVAVNSERMAEADLRLIAAQNAESESTNVLTGAMVRLDAAVTDAALTTTELESVEVTGFFTNLAAGAGAVLAALSPTTVGLAAVAVTAAAVAGPVLVVDANIKKLASDMAGFKGTPTELATELLLLGQKGVASGDLADAYGSKLEGLSTQFKNLHNEADKSANGFASKFVDFFQHSDSTSNSGLAAAYKSAQDNVKGLDAALAVDIGQQGDAKLATAAYNRVLAASGETAKQFATDMPQATAALKEFRLLAELNGGDGVDPLTGLEDSLSKAGALRSAIGDAVATKAAYIENSKAVVGQSQEENGVRLQEVATWQSDQKAIEQTSRALQDAEHAEGQAQQAVTAALYQRSQAEDGVKAAIYSRGQAVIAVSNAEYQQRQDEVAQIQLVKDLATAEAAATEAIYAARDATLQDSLSIQGDKYALQDAVTAAELGPTPSSSFSPIDPNAQNKLDLTVAEDKLHLAEALHQQEIDQTNANKATAAGVAGSPQVLAANAAIAAGAHKLQGDVQAVTDANHGLETSSQAVVTAEHGVETANQAVDNTYYALHQSQRTVVDDQAAMSTAVNQKKQDVLASELTIIAMESIAKGKVDELGTAYETATGKAAKALQDFGLKAEGVDLFMVAITRDAPAALKSLVDFEKLLAPIIVPTGATSGPLSVGVPGGRWGGVVGFADGGITDAIIAKKQMFTFAEPETGGEALIPRLGNRERSMSVLRTAAAWLGAAVVPADGRGGDGPSDNLKLAVQPVVPGSGHAYSDFHAATGLTDTKGNDSPASIARAKLIQTLQGVAREAAADPAVAAFFKTFSHADQAAKDNVAAIVAREHGRAGDGPSRFAKGQTAAEFQAASATGRVQPATASSRPLFTGPNTFVLKGPTVDTILDELGDQLVGLLQ